MGWNGRISLRVNEKDAITIKLLADDKIVLETNGFSGNSEDVKPEILTVEEYYNLSPKDGTSYVTEKGFKINVSDMVDDSMYHDNELEIREGMIHVVARYDGP